MRRSVDINVGVVQHRKLDRARHVKGASQVSNEIEKGIKMIHDRVIYR